MKDPLFTKAVKEAGAVCFDCWSNGPRPSPEDQEVSKFYARTETPVYLCPRHSGED